MFNAVAVYLAVVYMYAIRRYTSDQQASSTLDWIACVCSPTDRSVCSGLRQNFFFFFLVNIFIQDDMIHVHNTVE